MLSFHMGKLYQPYTNVQQSVFIFVLPDVSLFVYLFNFFSYAKHEILKLQHDLEEAEKVSHC